MARSQGFAIGDFDTSFPLDDKVLDLAARAGSRPVYYQAVGIYFHVFGAAWRDGERKNVGRLAPGASPRAVALLIEVGLLDADGMLPAKSFENWVGRAMERRRSGADRTKRSRNAAVTALSRDVTVSNGQSQSVTSSRARQDTPSQVRTDQDMSPAPAREEEEPEAEALTWLARHGCYIVPGNGYHRHLITAVERHGVNAIVGMFDRLAAAGTEDGDVKGFVFGAIDALNARDRPNLEAVEREEERAEDQVKRAAASARQLAKLRESESALTEEQRAANLARLHDEMAAKGLV